MNAANFGAQHPQNEFLSADYQGAASLMTDFW